MPTNLAIDDRLIEDVKRAGSHRTKKEAVTAALEEYLRRRQQAAVLDLAGKLEYRPDYSYQRLRRAKRR